MGTSPETTVVTSPATDILSPFRTHARTHRTHKSAAIIRHVPINVAGAAETVRAREKSRERKNLETDRGIFPRRRDSPHIVISSLRSAPLYPEVINVANTRRVSAQFFFSLPPPGEFENTGVKTGPIINMREGIFINYC